MAFIGAINDKLRRYFYTQAPHLEGKRCYIGCSGNFTIEQLLSRRCQNIELHSNDVSLYSTVIGRALMGGVAEVEFTSDELRWVNDYFRRGPAESVAAMLLVLEMLKYEKRKSDFARRMWTHYLASWEGFFSRTLAQVNKAFTGIRIASYNTVDVHDFYPRPDGVSIGFLPTYVGGYEKLFERLEASVAWQRPGYEMLTEERREETIRRMTEGEFILYDDRPRDLPCVAQVELFGKRTVFIYSNVGLKSGIFRRKMNEKVLPFDMLMPEDEVPDEPITIRQVEGAVVNHYRNLFLSKKIQPAAGDPNLLVFAGGKLFGCLIFQSYSKMGSGPADRGIYLLSDFVVPSTRHKRLSKLLLMAVTSREVRAFLEERLVRRIEYLTTTAFTDKPVSMKYRGLFELVKRGKGFLNYRAEFTDTSLAEVTAQWKTRFEKR